jgi:hypothetical protein
MLSTVAELACSMASHCMLAIRWGLRCARDVVVLIPTGCFGRALVVSEVQKWGAVANIGLEAATRYLGRTAIARAAAATILEVGSRWQLPLEDSSASCACTRERWTISTIPCMTCIDHCTARARPAAVGLARPVVVRGPRWWCRRRTPPPDPRRRICRQIGRFSADRTRQLLDYAKWRLVQDAQRPATVDEG